MRKFKKIAYLLIFLVLIIRHDGCRLSSEAFMVSTTGSKVSQATNERRWNTLSLDDDQRQLQQQQQQHVAVHSQLVSASSTSSMLHVAKKQKSAPSWDERFIELTEHKNKFNHTSVSKRLPEYVELGKWTNRQRQRYKHLALELEQCHSTSGDADCDSITNTGIDVAADVDEVALSRIRKLNSIGFEWDASHMKQQKERQQWFKRFDEICQVCQSHEDDEDKDKDDDDDESTNMRILHTKIPPLAKVELSASQKDWLRRQRRHYDNKLDVDQIEALNELDGTWRMNSRQRTFEIRFRELQVYKMTTGDCDVPISYSNRKLANWVSNLRKTNNSKPDNIDPSQRKRLDSLGFSWTRWDDFEDSWGIMSTTTTTTMTTTRTVESSSSTY